MGVKGLWELISPVARTVKLESLNNKRLAIDASIWLYQFLTAMRDREGNGLKNAHLLGFFRRICKLLFYNIKPVFVFDGGAPELKRLTLNERRKRRTGNANNLQKTAEKLLSIQMRLHAIQESKEPNSKKIKGSRKRVETDNGIYSDEPELGLEEPFRRRKRDEYDLPSLSGGIGSMIVKDDPRFATEEDLRDFIKEFKTDDIDIESETFRYLPLDVQYEIIGEYRIKSRQTSWDRFQEMVDNSPTAMDFSKQQIKYLVRRNNLTQKLIDVTNNGANFDEIAPIRIASERNKKYVLIKNREGNAGWTMGSINENESNNNEQVSSITEKQVDLDRNFDHDNKDVKSALSSDNYKDKNFEDYKSLSNDKRNNLPLDKNVYVEDDENIESVIEKSERWESEQLDDISNFDKFTSMEPELFHAFWLSRMSPAFQEEFYDHEDMIQKAIYVWNESELEEQKKSVTKKLGKLNEHDKKKADALNFWQKFIEATLEFRGANSEFDSKRDLETRVSDSSIAMDSKEQKIDMKETNHLQKSVHIIKKLDINFRSLILSVNHNTSSYHTSTSLDDDTVEAKKTSDSEEYEEIELTINPVDDHHQTYSHTISSSSSMQTLDAQKINSDVEIDVNTDTDIDTDYESQTNTMISKDASEIGRNLNSIKNTSDMLKENYVETYSDDDDESKNELYFESVIDNSDEEIPKQLSEEESEFARFLSELKKKDLDSVKQELSSEVQRLNEQRRREKRDADSVTQTMISECQKLLQLFGIPYITAPMEAEAQCAELLHHELVDGIVTDDSDVFLFGGSRIYKNMFSQQKYVECYLLQDLEQNMSLNREKLINLAILLGSDYADGLSGVGVVSAMEILHEFPGDKGLENFRDWWLEVQNGTNKPGNDESDFKKKFRKKMKNLILSKNFPNHHVSDAYLKPQVDDSKEPFEWAMPNMDDLRDFLMDNFLWSYEKVDETLVPLMKTLVKRQSEEKSQIALDDLSISSSSVYKSHKSPRIQRVIDSWKDGKRSREIANIITEREKSYEKKRKQKTEKKKR